MPIQPTNRPGEWLTVFPLNEHQELMTLEDFALLCPPEKAKVAGGEPGKQQSPAQVSVAAEIAQDLMAQLVHVHYHAASFDFWVSAVDPYSGELLGYVRILGSSFEGQWCSINYWDMAQWRFPERILLGDLMMIPVVRDAEFTTRTLREVLGLSGPADPGAPSHPDGGDDERHR
jgi:hypothetical protein